MLTLLIIPAQMLLVAFAMRGFKQGWNVELERRDPSYVEPPETGPAGGGYATPPPHPA